MTSVGSILGGAFGLLRRQPLSVLVWGLLHAAAMAAFFFAMRPIFQIYSDLITQQLAADPGKPLDPQVLQSYIAQIQGAGGIAFLAQIGLFVVQMVLFTATQRAVLRPAKRGFFFLRLGGDEFRLRGLAFFLWVCLAFAMFAVLLVLGIIVGIAAAASGSPGVAGLFFALTFLVVMGAMIYAMIRLSLAFPLTFLRRNFVIGEGWRLSKGRFWTLFGAYFVIALFQQLLATLLLGFAFAPVISEAAQGGGTPEAVRLALQHQVERFMSPDPGVIALGLAFALLGGLGYALFGGAMATAARDLTGVGEDKADTFA